jgi:hypothetical protein
LSTIYFIFEIPIRPRITAEDTENCQPSGYVKITENNIRKEKMVPILGSE